MHRARALEGNQQSGSRRGAGHTAPRPTPLTLVAGAVAGEDLQSVAASAADALGYPVAIAIPALGAPVLAPPDSLTADVMATIAAEAAAVAGGREPRLGDAVPIQIGELTVGIVAAAPPAGRPAADPERRAWLEAAAAASSVTALMRENAEGTATASDAVLLAELAAGPPADLPDFLVRARRHGVDLTGGAVAVSARRPGAPDALAPPSVLAELRPGALLAELRPGSLLALAPLPGPDGPDPAATLVEALRTAGLDVVTSAPRRDPALLHDAVREAELLAELGIAAAAAPTGPDETYRLLIGVLLRDRAELEQLRATTITPLIAYDARHDTDLMATLRTFLAHDGSTTETAETMKLHRHTVGYRLSRVHEVSGLSPYESGGRERLSLGLKAQEILEAEQRLEETVPLPH